MNIVYFDPGLAGRTGHNGAMLYEFDQALVVERGHHVQYLCHQNTRRDDVPGIAGRLVPTININGYMRLDDTYVLNPAALNRLTQVLAEDYRHADLENADVILMPTVYPLHLSALVQHVKLKDHCRVVLGLLLPCSYWASSAACEQQLNVLVLDSIARLGTSTRLITYSETGTYDFGSGPVTMATLLPPVAAPQADLIQALAATPVARVDHAPPVLGFFGAPFTTKGFTVLLEALQAIVQNGLPVHIQLRIHLPHGHAEACAGLNRLAPWIQAESVQTSNADYLRKMADVDIVWACYDPSEYGRKMSGIVPEAISLGKPLLLAEGCDAIQDFLERYAPGSYVTVPYAMADLITVFSMPADSWRHAIQCARTHQSLMQNLKSMTRYLTVVGLETGRCQAHEAQDLQGHDIFARHAQRLGVSRILDIGSTTASFVPALRSLGFNGTVMSAAATPALYQALLTQSQPDLRWMVLPGAGHPQEGERHRLNLPSQELVASTDALRISASLCRGGLLQRIIEDNARLRLIWIVNDLTDQASAATDFTDLHDVFVNEQGYQAASDSAGMYVKEQALLSETRMGITLHSVVTSIGGPLRRQDAFGNDIGADWLQACIQSWMQTAPNLVSISETEPPDEHILWDITTEKPYISEVIARLKPRASRHVLITNADIMLTDSLRDNLATLDPEVMYYSHRFDVEVDPDTNTTFRGRDYWRWGYDVFLLPPALIASLQCDKAIPAFLRYGEPWWDYCLPILAMAKGFPIKNIRTTDPVALPLFHEQKYSQQMWVEHGQRFLQWLESLRHQAEHPIDEFLELVLEARPGAKVVDRLQHASSVITSMMP